MKASLFAVSCILLGVAACSAPQGKKLGANTNGLAPVAAGPTTTATTLTISQNGEAVSMPKDGTVTVTLDSAQQDGYMWRLAEIPDPSVLKVATQDYIAPSSGVGRGQEKWVFQAIGPGDVDVKMWYGSTREGSLTTNPTFNFIASVSDQIKPEKKPKSTKTKKTVADL